MGREAWKRNDRYLKCAIRLKEVHGGRAGTDKASPLPRIAPSVRLRERSDMMKGVGDVLDTKPFLGTNDTGIWRSRLSH